VTTRTVAKNIYGIDGKAPSEPEVPRLQVSPAKRTKAKAPTKQKK
jgi:hypothetical protein